MRVGFKTLIEAATLPHAYVEWLFFRLKLKLHYFSLMLIIPLCECMTVCLMKFKRGFSHIAIVSGLAPGIARCSLSYSLSLFFFPVLDSYTPAIPSLAVCAGRHLYDAKSWTSTLSSTKVSLQETITHSAFCPYELSFTHYFFCAHALGLGLSFDYIFNQIN